MTTRRRPRHGGRGGQEPRAVIETRAQRAWELEAAGQSQREIAHALGVSQPAVAKMLRRLAEGLAAQRRHDHDRQRERMLNRLEHLLREALRGFERSQRDKTVQRQRQVTDPEGEVTRILEVETAPRDGDARFLEQAGRALERAAEIQGLTTHGPSRSTGDGAASTARDRLAGKLGRLALAGTPAPPQQPE